jgi:hypothetical protein
MSVVVSRQSRLRFKNLLTVRGVTFWELDNLPQVPVQPSDFYIVVNITDRIDNLAFSYYGDPNLWWVIALANDFYLLPTDLQVGSTIRIPSPTYVADTLFAKKIKQ